MSKAKIGDKVKIHYTGYLKDGTVFDSTVNEGPIVCTVREGIDIQCIEKKDITVSNISDSSITINADYLLAGKELTFEIVLLEIVEH